MPTIKGPLFSRMAKGHFSDQMTFFRRLFVGQRAGFGRMPFGAYFFGYGGTINPFRGSMAQQERRALFSSCWHAWSLLTTEQKAEYSEEAKSLNMTGANLFMSQFIKNNI